MTDRTKPPSIVHRYPIASFFILAFALGAGAVFLVGQGVVPSTLALASAVSASVAGVITTAVADGKAGLKLMLSRLLIWRVGIGYWLFALLFIILAVVLGSLTNPLFNGDSPHFRGLYRPLQIIPLFIAFFIVSGLGQELGWTGFLTPRLQTRFGALISCAIRAALVSLWHLPLFFYASLRHPAFVDFPYTGWIAQKGFLAAIAAHALMFSLPWSVLFTWIFNNTKGSLLLVAVLHGSEVWVAYWMLDAGINQNNLDNYLGYGALLILAAILVILRNGPQDLSRKQKRIVHQSSGRNSLQ